MRFFLILLHRWAGLAIAAFLFVSGVTGAVISWDHELDELLNAHLLEAHTPGTQKPPLELAREVEARDSRIRAVYVPLAVAPGESLSIFVEPRIDPTSGRLFEPGYNQVFLDPVSGVELGRREWGPSWPITRETFVSCLYRLHYTLHIPEMWGIDRWGQWLMGGIAMLWTFDCFVGFYLTLPVRRPSNCDRPVAVERALKRGWWSRWKPSWKIKTSGSIYRVNVDIHRALGLWTWLLLFILALTGFSLNLNREIFLPLLSFVSTVSPTPFTDRTALRKDQSNELQLGFADIVDRAKAEAAHRGWQLPLGAVFYSAEYGVFGARFFAPGEDHGAAGVGPPDLYFSSHDGRLIGDREPWKGTVADIFVQAQFPLHSGRILGLPGRILVSVMGIVVAALSLTGVVIFYRKYRARVAVRLLGTITKKHLAARRTTPSTS